VPALPPAPGIVKVTIPYTLLSSSSALNRFYIHYTGTPPTSGNLATFCDAVSAAWNTDLAPLCYSLITQQVVAAEDLSTATGAVAVGTTTHTGTRSGHPFASGTATIVEFKIARRYRGGKPKIFLPAGVSEDMVASGVWGGTYVSSVATDWAAFIAAVIGAGWAGAGTVTHANVSYYNGFTSVQNPITHRWKNVPTLRGTPLVDTVTSYGVEAGMGSQRRRNNV